MPLKGSEFEMIECDIGIAFFPIPELETRRLASRNKWFKWFDVLPVKP